jgi:hypothetical protein
VPASPEVLRQTGLRSQVPLWVPWPLPAGWLLAGLRCAGDEHTGPVATVVACSGPNPLTLEPGEQRTADLLLVAEQPGVGLAAHLAGLEAIDPGSAVATGSPHLKLVAAGHDTPLWALDVAAAGGDEAVAAYVGEAAGEWLWAIAWPHTGAAVLLEQFELRDARDAEPFLDLPSGIPSRRLG